MTRPLPVRFAAIGLIALMAIGSIMMWLGAPIFWIWLASHTVDSSQPQLGAYMLVIVGIPTTMVILGKALSKLNRIYAEMMGTVSEVRVPAPWLRSLRGERESTRPRTVLDVVMVWSVGLAVVVMGFWFFFIAGSSLPQ